MSNESQLARRDGGRANTGLQLTRGSRANRAAISNNGAIQISEN